MKSFKKFINEDVDDIERIFIDTIEMFIENGNKEKELHYRLLYKKKYGKEYNEVKPFTPEPSLDKIYTKNDFKRYSDYLQYSEKLFKLKFKTYKGNIKELSNSKSYITPEQLIQFHLDLDIIIEFKTPKGTEEGYVAVGDTKKITYDKKYQKIKLAKEIIIHELGHILDNKLKNVSVTNELFLFHNKCSAYDLDPGEIFAESFKTYILYPKFLKAGWMDVYNFFNKKTPMLWKKELSKLIHK